MDSTKNLGLDETRDFLKNHPRGVIINVLTPGLYARRHIPGSKQACVFETAFLERMAEAAPAKNDPVLLYGAGASLDAATAAEKLREAGYTDIYVFPGGLQAWRAAGFPLEGTAPEAEDPPFPSVVPACKQYRLLPDKSRLAWVGRADSHQHWGTLGLKSGELKFVGANGIGSIVADMKAIRCADLAGEPELHDRLLAHLSSGDFFLSRLFPEASLEITDLHPLTEPPAPVSTSCAAEPNYYGGASTEQPGWQSALPNYYGRGSLKIRNKVEFIEANLALRNLEDGGLSLAGQIQLDRTRWGVLYGSARFFRFLEMHKVDDVVSLDAMLFFQADGPANA